jgi:hypothetical protein
MQEVLALSLWKNHKLDVMW